MEACAYPAAHDMQEELEFDAENDPLAQSMHDALPKDEYLPATQSPHTLCPARENVPATHEAHAPFETLLNVPGEQRTHPGCPSLSVLEPKAQPKQNDAPVRF